MKTIKLVVAVSLLFVNVFAINAQSMSKKFRTVKVEIKIDAPAEKVWQAMVLDYGNIGNFSPYIYSSNYLNGSLKGEVGAERRCNLDEDGKQWVKEQIKAIDTENMLMTNVPIGGEGLPLNFDNSRAFYQVKANADGTSTASYEFQFRTSPAIMGFIAKGGFKKQLAGTLIGLKHFVETNEKVTPMNGKYDKIKEKYKATVVQ